MDTGDISSPLVALALSSSHRAGSQSLSGSSVSFPISVDIQALGASNHIFRVSWTTPGVSEPVSVRIGQTHGTVANNLESWMIWPSKYISCYEHLFLGHLHARGYGGSSFRPVPSSACSVEQEDTALIRRHRGFSQLLQGRGARLWSSVPTRRMKVMWRIK